MEQERFVDGTDMHVEWGGCTVKRDSGDSDAGFTRGRDRKKIKE